MRQRFAHQSFGVVCWQSKTDKSPCCCLFQDLEAALPEFSEPVLQSLNKGECEGNVWKQACRELAEFCLKRDDCPCTEADYTRIGKVMFSKFPCINADGEHPWVSVTAPIFSPSSVLAFFVCVCVREWSEVPS